MSEPTLPTEYEWMRRVKPDDISLRDFFAAAALTGIYASGDVGGLVHDPAACAYKVADAMLQARTKGGA